MAERAYDDDDVTCFLDDDGVNGWLDDDGNWLGFYLDAVDNICIPAGLQQFTCRFE